MKKTRLISLLVTIVMFLSLVNCQNTPQSNIQELGSKKDFKVNTIMYYDDDGDVTEPIEEACAEGYTGACELQKLLEDKKQAKNNPNDPNKPKTKPTPKPKPSPSDECKDSKSISPSQLQLAPTGFSTMSFHTKNFTVDTITDNINYLIEKTEMAKVYKIKYDGFLADKTTDPTKLSELKKQLDDEIAERDLITQQVLQGLNDYKVSLRNQVNTLMGDPNYSVDDTVKPIDLQGYKDTIYLLNDDFLVYVDSENTYGLIDSLNVLANENKLLIDLINNFTTNTLLDLPTTNNTNNLSTIDNLTKPEQVIRYFSNQINNHRNNIVSINEKLKEETTKLDNEIIALTEVEDIINKYIIDSNRLKNNISNNISKIDTLLNETSNNTPNSFNILIFMDEKLPARDRMEYESYKLQERLHNLETKQEKFDRLAKDYGEGKASKTELQDARKELNKENQEQLKLDKTVDNISKNVKQSKADKKAKHQEKVQANSCNLKFGNPKSIPTYEHTFSEHGQKRPIKELLDRAKTKNTNQGQWDNDNAAAKILDKNLLDSLPKGNVKQTPRDLPNGVTGKVFRPDGSIGIADSFIAVPNGKGGYTTAYPTIKSEDK